MLARNLLVTLVVLGGLAMLALNLAPTRPRDPPGWSPRADAATGSAMETTSRLDTLLADDWRAKQIEPAPQADELLVARRLSLALCGAVPSLEEFRWLEAQPHSTRLGRWTECLLHDRRSAEYLAERLARAFVGVEDGPLLLYRRRRFVTWLADQLAENRPYNEIVAEMIRADGLWTSQPATNFITATITPGDDRNIPDPEKLTPRLSRAVLGTRLDCCQCHDYPFPDKPWKQGDFQQLAAFFGRARLNFGGLHDQPGDYVATNPYTGQEQVVAPAVPFQAECLPEQGAPRERLAAWATHDDNLAYRRAIANRCWTLLFGLPLSAPIDDVPLASLVEIGQSSDKTNATPPSAAHRALDLLSEDFVLHGHDLQRLLRTIALSRAFSLEANAADDSGSAGDGASWAAFPLTPLRSEQVVGALIQSASIATVDHQSHILFRFVRAVQLGDFVKQYGDAGVDELEPRAGSISQQLLLMNGEVMKERTDQKGILNASARIAALAGDDAKAIETAYLCTLTRRPAPDELDYFLPRLKGVVGDARSAVLEDLFWTLLNSTEFAWNH